MLRFRFLAVVALVLAVACAGEPTAHFLQAEADALLKEDSSGGVILAVVERDGGVLAAASGVETNGETIRADQRFRIGSITKTFIATVVLSPKCDLAFLA